MNNIVWAYNRAWRESRNADEYNTVFYSSDSAAILSQLHAADDFKWLVKDGVKQ